MTQMLETFTCCPLCGSRSAGELFSHIKFGRFVKCSPCNLVYVAERPTPPWIEMRKTEPYRSEPFPEIIISRGVDLRDDFMNILNQLKKYKNDGKLLEVGCLAGHFLKLASESGYTVDGVEPDFMAAASARKSFGLNVHECIVQDLPFEDKMFDAIVMLNVLEHLNEPSATLTELHRVLSDSGILMIEVPIIDTALFNLLGKYHRHVIMDHILLFSQKSLNTFMDKHGFCPVHSELSGRRIRLGRIAWNFRNYSELLGGFLEGLMKMTGLYDLCIRVNLRDIAQVYYRKKPA